MAAEKETINAHYVPADLKVEDLQSSEWNQAEPIMIDRYWSGEPAPESRLAEARILWSSSALYVRFICNQTEEPIVSSHPQTANKTKGLWDRDVCEIFIAPNPEAVERYFEFEAAPTGEWLDVAIHWTPDRRDSDWTFDSSMTTAARLEAERVTIVMRIPWSDQIHQPQRGEIWPINLFRCVGRDPNRGYLAWQPTRTLEPAFHVPAAFGWLVFE